MFNLINFPQGRRQVAYGEIAPNLALIATVAGGTFCGGVNAVGFQDGNHLLELTDSNGYKATGYISGTAPGGLTLGAEILLTPDFAADTNWAKQSGWSISAGVGVGTAAAYELYQDAASVAGALYKSQVELVSRTGGSIGHYHSYEEYLFQGITALGVQSVYVTAGGASIAFTVRGDGFSGTIDNASYKRVTDCAATGALIVSAQGGATRAWTSKDASFNPRLAMTYKIYRLP